MQRKRIGVAAAGGALALGGVLAAVPGSASAAAPSAASDVTVMAGCGKTYDVSIPGGQSHYTVSCGSTTHVSGWLKDTAADGKCVQVKIWRPAHHAYTYTDKACPKATVKHFDHNGRSNPTPPSVYTYAIG
ncbi:hypothetical protein [Streptomyces sp. H27-D2]|uniref:hypothetical protein n=1 Tax=Streptomyces sp. H27-D2 TaxID=3046304 RepID=UPI002DB697FC|nr:hypothetical protein [Streptomyces sp. H27-D2]MEC4016384.1 hypothetical protein [Streptomyces sp. H27-D2]